MGKVIAGAAISLDGFINDANGDVSRLYPDFAEFRESELIQGLIKTVGAVVMGHRAYDMGEGDFTGYEYQVPIFILVHTVPEKVAKGENDKMTFTFVTDGIESAIQQAQIAAGDKDVVVVGGRIPLNSALMLGWWTNFSLI